MIPDFARGYPEDPALGALVEAFARGDYRSVRAGAARLIASTEDEEVRAAAKELAARTGADRTMTVMFAIASAALAIVWGYWLVVAR